MLFLLWFFAVGGLFTFFFMAHAEGLLVSAVAIWFLVDEYRGINRQRAALRSTIPGKCPYCGIEVTVLPPSAECPRCRNIIAVSNDGSLVRVQEVVKNTSYPPIMESTPPQPDEANKATMGLSANIESREKAPSAEGVVGISGVQYQAYHEASTPSVFTGTANVSSSVTSKGYEYVLIEDTIQILSKNGFTYGRYFKSKLTNRAFYYGTEEILVESILGVEIGPRGTLRYNNVVLKLRDGSEFSFIAAGMAGPRDLSKWAYAFRHLGYQF